MREIIFTVSENDKLTENIYRMKLTGDTSDITQPGQFINIKIPNLYLRRPFSVCDWDDGELTIIYKVVGSGTRELSEMKEGVRLSTLSGLGNGYDLNRNFHNPIALIGGGVGIPPLYGLAKKLAAQKIFPEVILGFNKLEECFYVEEFCSLGLNVKITTLDGSLGVKGLVTDALKGDEYAFVCGPMPMLKAVYKKVHDGQFSFEARMGCGFGVCMGCSVKTKNGSRRICKDGPVFDYSEIIFGDD